MSKCCVFKCGARKADGVSLFQFPRNRRLRSKWSWMIGRHRSDGYDSTMVCSRHFPDNLIDKKAKPRPMPRLKKGAFPALQLNEAPTAERRRRRPVRSRTEPMEMLASPTGGSLHFKDYTESSATSLLLGGGQNRNCAVKEVLVGAAFRDDGDSESDSFSPRSELAESQPTTRPRYKGMYHCEFCPYSSRQLGHVTEHERTHTGEKPFRCSVCERAFSLSGHLRNHMRTHTGEKPFRCEVCQKAFTRSYHLMIHKRIHTGKRPYQCGTCEKEFSHKSGLLCHERTHSGERPYKCDACGKMFEQGHHLSRHRKKMQK